MMDMKLFALFCLALLLLPLRLHAAVEKPATEKAIFAGGCFWCMQSEFSGTEGVVSVTSGYTGGTVKNPTYEQVSSGMTGHAESIEVVYDPAKVTYEKLLKIYWGNIDPTDQGGQFADRGTQYRTAIFYTTDAQRQQAEASKKQVEEKLKATIYTEITKASEFYPAEEYHQDYAKKNPVHYNAYKYGSGRVSRLKELWGPDQH
jgi:methionine-S-sulfoxide reductase